MKPWIGRLREVWNGSMANYRWALLVLLLGVVLMMVPSSGEGQQKKNAPEEGSDPFDLEMFEEKLARTLSQVRGAGDVEVILTLDSGSRRVLAQDREQDEQGTSATTVTLGKGSGSQSVVDLQTVAPSFRGALVVCPGGEDPAVRLALTKAVSALTGLGANRISICAGRS